MSCSNSAAGSSAAHNFGFVNDGFRELGYRLLSYDARGYGASSSPREWYTIEGWADDGAKLLDALGLERVLVHGTSMGGMIAIAFTAKYGRQHDRRLRGRRIREAGRLPADPLPGLAPDGGVDAVGRLLRPRHDAGCRRPVPRERAGRDTFELVRSVIGVNDPYTVRQACIAMEEMDLSPLVPQIDRPLLMTNGTYDILCPPELAPSGLGARQMAALNPLIRVVEFPGHRSRRPARVPGRTRSASWARSSRRRWPAPERCRRGRRTAYRILPGANPKEEHAWQRPSRLDA